MVKSQKEPNLEEKIPNTPIRFLWFVSRGSYRFFFGAVLGVTLAQIFSISVPYIIRSIIDGATAFSNGTGELESVWFWVFAYPIAILLMFLSWRASGFFGMEWASRLNAISYSKLFKHLSLHSQTYFSNRFAGSLSSKMGYASEGSQSLGESFLWQYYTGVLSFLFTLILLGTSSLVGAALFLSLIIIILPLNYYLAKYRRKHLLRYTAQVTKTRGFGVDAITNMAAVRQFAREDKETARFGDEITSMRFLNIRQWRISEWGLLLNNVLIVFFMALILISTFSLWTKDLVTLGELVMVIALLANIQSTLVHIGMDMNRFIRQYAEIEEGLGDILVTHDIKDQPEAIPLIADKGEIVWQDVNFNYETKAVFKDFNLTIKSGERIGLVGSSGAGKTTFVSLLLRQHNLDGGVIYIDGQDISNVQQKSLRGNITIVPQEPMLFHRSIRENIAYGKPWATEAEIEQAARRAHAVSFIEEMPLRYDTMVGERGVKLSGGQKQRIAIARAMLKDAPIIVLDEATSALDSESEVEIQKALHELMVGKTVIAIAHRLSTLREMDRIIVLQNGVIVEDGSHNELIKRQGQYARLWAHQAGGFLSDEE